MNWYLQQKVAWNWKSMLPTNSAPKSNPQQAIPMQGKPQRTRQEVELDKRRVQNEMNAYRGPRKMEPGAAQKLQQLQIQFKQLLDESANLHDSHYDAAMAAA